MPKKRKIIIAGAAGRDFHNFNVCFRDNKDCQVIAFTATQIPGIAGRKYPKELAGKGYPKGIPIFQEENLAELIKKNKVDDVILAYSDLSYAEVMQKASIILAAGANFKLLGKEAMLKSKKPVIAVCAVRTGAGKSPVSRKIAGMLKSNNKRVGIIRHPMPYGDLTKQVCQKFETMEDMEKHKCTIEEMEEYAPHILDGNIVYAGVDYAQILKTAEKQCDIILWDGGNNDTSFIKPDLLITVADCRRPGHEISYYPGEVNLRTANIIIANKVDSSSPENIDIVIKNSKQANKKAEIIRGALLISVDNPEILKTKRALVIEDGPTITHGGLSSGAGFIAANNYGAYVVNPRQFAVGSIKDIYSKYPHIGPVLPAMGYSTKQIKELEETINKVECDVVIIGTPIDISRFMHLNKPCIKVKYEFKEIGSSRLEEIINRFVKKL